MQLLIQSGTKFYPAMLWHANTGPCANHNAVLVHLDSHFFPGNDLVLGHEGIFLHRFVRDFSAADIMMSFPIIATENNCKLEQYPHLVKYLAAVRERPAYKRAIEKAGGEFKM